MDASIQELAAARFSGLVGDIWFALRLMRKKWGFTLTVVLTLALTIGANTAVFSLLQGVLLKNLPFPNANRLVHLWASWPGGFGNMSYPDYQEMLRENRSFEEIAAYESWGNVALTGGDRLIQLRTEFVTPNFFRILGAKTAVGRLFQDDENRAEGGHPLTILSYGLWQQQYGADPNIVGRAILLNGSPFRVLGVLSREFRDPGEVEEEPRDIFLPTTMAAALLGQAPLSGPTQIYWALGLMKPGVGIEQALENLKSVSRQMEKLYPATHKGQALNAQPLSERVNGAFRGPVVALMIGALFVLLIGCANISNSLLSRMTQRRREIAVRTALGASETRVIQQLLVENALLGIAGGSLGLLLTWWAIPLLSRIVHRKASTLIEVDLSATALVLGIGLSLLTVLLFGMIPAWRGRRLNLAETLKQGGRQGSLGSHGTFRAGLVVAEVGFSIVLLMGAGLMLRSVDRLAKGGLGFPTGNLLTFRLSLSGNRYQQPAGRVQFVNEFIDRMSATPGISGVTLLGPSMLSNASWVVSIYPYENQPSSPSDFVMVYRHSVNPGGLENLGVAIQQGRDFTRFDTAQAPLVAILSEGAARRLWPKGDAVGKQLRREDPGLPPITVVGIASDAVHRKRYSLASAEAGLPMGGLGPQRDLYLPYPQRPNTDVTFAVRLGSDPRQSTEAIRGALARIDQDLPLTDVEMLDDRLAGQNAAPSAIAALLGGYAAFALFLAALGVYGVMTQWVIERTRELGIRVALGAKTQNILALVLGKGFGLIVVGVILGMASSWWLTRGLEGLLYGISRGDTITLLGVPAVLATTGLVACWLPARRALSANPIEVLRAE